MSNGNGLETVNLCEGGNQVEGPELGTVKPDTNCDGSTKHSTAPTVTDSEAGSATGNIINYQKGHKMTREEFWAIIDSTLEAKDQDAQYELIKAEVAKLNEAQIKSFINIMLDLCYELEDWPLWGVGVVLGFSSNAEFFKFCLWTISKGQSVYTNAQKNPDSLAEVITQKDIDVRVNFERLLNIASEVYKMKTGKIINIGVRSNYKQRKIGSFLEVMKMVFIEGPGKKGFRNSGGG
jgi:hypothetical protein